MISAVSILCGIYLLLLLTKAALARYAAERDTQVSSTALQPGTLTVAQAILSGDAGLETMLESNLHSLSGQHFLWLCDTTDAEAQRITLLLKERHTEQRITILNCPPCPADTNPKVFKLILGSSSIDTPFFVVLDDDTHLPAATAAALVDQAQHHDLATGLPYYLSSPDLPSRLLAQFVNNNSAMTYLSLLPFAPPVSINGMCYVMRSERRDLFPAISHHLTDDLALALEIQRRGGSIHQSSLPQQLTTRLHGFRHYLRMMHRWHLFALLLLREQPLHIRLVIFLLHGWHPLAILFSLAMLPFGGAIAWSTFGVLLVGRHLILAWLQKRVFGKVLISGLLSPLSEMLQPFHLLHALLNRHIDWRGRRYLVSASDRFTAEP